MKWMSLMHSVVESNVIEVEVLPSDWEGPIEFVRKE